jgi:hypothetical protein
MSEINIFEIIKRRIIWEKALIITGYDSKLFRADRFRMLICFSEYGNRDSKYGWEIDHIIPVDIGGTNDYSNLEPLNWKNNTTKSNKIL